MRPVIRWKSFSESACCAAKCAVRWQACQRAQAGGRLELVGRKGPSRLGTGEPIASTSPGFSSVALRVQVQGEETHREPF
jgi:hypothetical protein